MIPQLKRRHLRLARVLAANNWRKRKGQSPDGVAGPPVNVHLQPTLACNLHCKMCIQNGPAGYLKGGDPIVKARLPVEDYDRLLSESASHGPFVHIWGGEPLLYKQIDELVDAVRRHDLVLMMTTNTVKGMDHFDTLMKLDVLRISIDGPGDVHDSIRGRPGTFQRAIDLIRAVAEERRKRRSYWPRIVTNSLLIDESYERLHETVGILAELPLDRCDLSLPMFTNEKRGLAYQRILEKEWGAEAKAWKGFEIESITVDIDRLTKLLEEVRVRHRGNRFSLFPIGEIGGVREWYEELDQDFGFHRCHAVEDNFNVLPNGDVVLCNDLPDLVIGNITEQSFSEIWNGERARSFRVRLNKGLLPVCSRCCLLYTFPIFKAAWQQRKLRK